MIIKNNQLEWVPDVSIYNDVYNVNAGNSLSAVVLTDKYNSPTYNVKEGFDIVTAHLCNLIEVLIKSLSTHKIYLMLHITMVDNRLNRRKGIWRTKDFQHFDSSIFAKGNVSESVRGGSLDFYSYVGFEYSKEALSFCASMQGYANCLFMMLSSSSTKESLDQLVAQKWEVDGGVVPKTMVNFLSKYNAILLHSIEWGNDTEWGAVAVGSPKKLNDVYKKLKGTHRFVN